MAANEELLGRQVVEGGAFRPRPNTTGPTALAASS
jgi:hypothetical protein